MTMRTEGPYLNDVCKHFGFRTFSLPLCHCRNHATFLPCLPFTSRAALGQTLVIEFKFVTVYSRSKMTSPSPPHCRRHLVIAPNSMTFCSSLSKKSKYAFTASGSRTTKISTVRPLFPPPDLFSATLLFFMNRVKLGLSSRKGRRRMASCSGPALRTTSEKLGPHSIENFKPNF